MTSGSRAPSDVQVGDLVRRAPKRGWVRSGKPLGRVTELIEVNGKCWARVSTKNTTIAWPTWLLEVMDET